MKINDSSNSAVNLAVDKAAAEKASANVAKTKADKAVSSAEANSADNVTLSQMAQQLKSIESSGATGQVFDAAKVNEIKEAIANGQFKVDTEKVANGLIESVKDMLTSK